MNMSSLQLLHLHQQQSLPLRYIQTEEPKYTSTNSHFVSPGELSVTYFTLTNWIEQLYPAIIRTDSIYNYQQFSTPLQFVYNYHCDYPTLKFINVIDAVPDILKNNRPGNFIFTSTLISVSIGRNDNFFPHCGNNLIKKLQRRSTSEYSIAINPHWSLLLQSTQTNNNNSYETTKFFKLQENLLIRKNCDCQLEIIDDKFENNLSNNKIHSGILQDDMKFDCDKMKIIKGVHEINSATEATSGPQIRFIPTNDDVKKDEVISSSDESDRLMHTTADFIARAARRTSRASSSDSGISIDESTNDVQNSKVTTVKEIQTTDEKRLNKLAEDFCFGSLMTSPFLMIFDEYSKSRRRMEYTKLLIERINNEHSNNNDKNPNVSSTNVIEKMNCNGEINTTVSFRPHHLSHSHQNDHNYNNNSQASRRWRRDKNHLFCRIQDRH